MRVCVYALVHIRLSYHNNAQPTGNPNFPWAKVLEVLSQTLRELATIILNTYSSLYRTHPLKWRLSSHCGH
jgi:hypothetical protein